MAIQPKIIWNPNGVVTGASAVDETSAPWTIHHFPSIYDNRYTPTSGAGFFLGYKPYSEVGSAWVTSVGLDDWETATWYDATICVNHNTKTYLCLVEHTSGATTEPGIGVDREDYWVILYVVDHWVKNGGSGYRCIANNTPATSNEPGVGADWKDYWIGKESYLEVNVGKIGGWTISQYYLYNLVSGVPESSAKGGVILSAYPAGNQLGLRVYDNESSPHLRVNVGKVNTTDFGLLVNDITGAEVFAAYGSIIRIGGANGWEFNKDGVLTGVGDRGTIQTTSSGTRVVLNGYYNRLEFYQGTHDCGYIQGRYVEWTAQSEIYFSSSISVAGSTNRILAAEYGGEYAIEAYLQGGALIARYLPGYVLNDQIKISGWGIFFYNILTSSYDVNLYRSAADVLATDDDFKIVTEGKKLLFAEDTNLYRSAANVLKTDDSFHIMGSVGIGIANSNMRITVIGDGTYEATYNYVGEFVDQISGAAKRGVILGYWGDGASAATAGTISVPNNGHLLINATGGNVAVGMSAPTARLHLAAGTAVAGTAPLKFTTGVALTTPETGVIEFHDSRFYITNKAVRKAIDRTSDVVLSTITVTNTTVETVVFTGLVPANSLVAGNVLKIYMSGTIDEAAAADAVTIRVKFGTSTVATIVSPGTGVAAKCWHIVGFVTMRSVGASGSMAWHLDMISDTNSVDTCGINTVDTTTAQNITVTAQWNTEKAGNIFTSTQGHMGFKN